MERNAGLELVRGLAALVVLATHLTVIPGVRERAGPAVQLLHWGTEAVVVFFLLSGVVIRLSQDRRPRTRSGFLLSRAVRILPLYWVAVALTLAVSAAADSSPPADTVVGNLMFLQTLPGYIVPVLGFNQPLWSLSYEAFFYLAFALSVGRYQAAVLAAWAIVALAAVGYMIGGEPSGIVGHFATMTAYSSIWLLGYALPGVPARLRPGTVTGVAFLALVPSAARLDIPGGYYNPAKHLLVAVLACPLFLSLLTLGRLPSGRRPRFWWPVWFATYAAVAAALVVLSSSLWASKLIYLALPWPVTAIAAAVARVAPTAFGAAPFALALGRLSYALYLFHYPILSLAAVLGLNVYAGLLVLPAAAVAFAVAGEYGLQPFVYALVFPKPPLPRVPRDG